jgi:hypothetical protein
MRSVGIRGPQRLSSDFVQIESLHESSSRQIVESLLRSLRVVQAVNATPILPVAGSSLSMAPMIRTYAADFQHGREKQRDRSALRTRSTRDGTCIGGAAVDVRFERLLSRIRQRNPSEAGI